MCLSEVAEEAEAGTGLGREKEKEKERLREVERGVGEIGREVAKDKERILGIEAEVEIESGEEREVVEIERETGTEMGIEAMA